MSDASYVDLRYVEAAGIADIVIDRPDVHNALREQTIRELIDAFDRADAAVDVGVVVLSGAGEAAFSTGGDVGMEGRFTGAEGRRIARLMLRLAEAVRGTGKPVIAKLRGWCVGGGNELMLLCDLSIAAESARFAHTDSRLGNAPIWFGTQLMAQLVGEQRAKEIILLGGTYSARRAEAIGWINRAVPDAELDDAARAWCERLLASSPQAMRLSKTSINGAGDAVLASVRHGFETMGYIYDTPEFHEGTEAFLQRRAPRFRDPQDGPTPR